MRTDLELIKDIVEYCVGVPKRSTWITRSCNLNHQLLNRLLSLCTSKGLIEVTYLKCPDGKGYLTTEKGKRYMQKFYALVQLISIEVPVAVTSIERN